MSPCDCDFNCQCQDECQTCFEFSRALDGKYLHGKFLCAECLSECEHADMDEGQCLDCGKDRREELMADAYDRAKDARYE